MGLKPHLCARFHRAVELIGGRWTGAVIQLLLNGRLRFAELRSSIPEISDRMLSERLRELESEGIVARRVVPETPVRVEYELTEKGRALEQALSAVGRWAERWVGEMPSAAGSSESKRAADPKAKNPRPVAARRRAGRGAVS
ncbi:MAG: helix-turn-helix domain-containing protein [Vicinamibacterales bacterium]